MFYMANQYADAAFMKEYSAYINENFAKLLDADSQALVLETQNGNDSPYLILKGADNNIQITLDGSLTDSESDSGMGVRFQLNNTQDHRYGSVALKAAPAQNWYHVLTLPNETGTLATQNYVTDEIMSEIGTKSSPFYLGYFDQLCVRALDMRSVAAGGTSDGTLYCGELRATGDVTVGGAARASDYYIGSSKLISCSSATSMTSQGSATNVTSAYAGYITLRSAAADMFCIAYGFANVSSGSDGRTATIELPITFTHLFSVTANNQVNTGSSNSAYYNGIKTPAISSSGGLSNARSFTVQIGFAESCRISWIAVGTI